MKTESFEGHLLIVDDDKSMAELYAHKLPDSFEVSTVYSGEEAMQQLKSDDTSFDLVLSDIQMPDEDGFSVLESIRDKKTKTELPVIMITGSPHSDRVVQSLKQGANDFVSKSVDFEVILARIRTQLSLKRADEKIRLHADKLEKLNRRKDRELEMGWEIQSELLPESLPDLDQYEFGLKYVPSSRLGGDFYGSWDFEETDWTLLYLADAAGHGVPAALQSVLMKAQSELLIQNSEQLELSLYELNDRLNEILPSGKFLSTFFLLVNNKTPRIKFFKCSQEPGLLLERDGSLKTLQTDGVLLGAFGSEFVEVEENFQAGNESLEPGDRIVLYTDGVTEAEDQSGNLFGNERFREIICQEQESTPGEFCENVYEEVMKHSNSEQLADDFSILTVDVRG